MPRIDQHVLDAAPRLRAVLHAAGSVRHLVSEPSWDRGVLVSSAAAANAIPVAEYALASILLAGKDAFRLREAFGRAPLDPHADQTIGNYRRRVGVIGASAWADGCWNCCGLSTSSSP